MELQMEVHHRTMELQMEVHRHPAMQQLDSFNVAMMESPANQWSISCYQY
jgi:hypothetical protein